MHNKSPDSEGFPWCHLSTCPIFAKRNAEFRWVALRDSSSHNRRYPHSAHIVKHNDAQQEPQGENLEKQKKPVIAYSYL